MDKLIGMILPDGTNQFFSNLAQAFQRELARYDYALIVLNSDSAKARELISINMLSNMNIDGLVFISVSDSGDAFIKLQELSIPMLILDREVPLENADFLLTDNNLGIKSVVDYLSVHNFNKIGIIQGSLDTEPGRTRFKKFIHYMSKKGIDIDPQLIFPGDFMFASGNVAAERILSLPPEERPDAIFASNDLMAIGLIQKLLENSVKIPEEISVIGFDDIPLSSWIYPRLTTVRQDLTEISRIGVKLLLDRINYDSSKSSTSVATVTPSLIVRESCK